jgi:uncharacterized protein (TIGR02271 family)
MIVLDKDGLQGTFDLPEPSSGDEKGTVVIHFQNGQHVAVQRRMLIPQANGRFALDMSVKELMASEQNGTLVDSTREGKGEGKNEYSVLTVGRVGESEQELVIPVIEEQVSVHKHTRESGVVEIHKTVHERTEVIDHPLLSEEVEIERVSVNRIVDEPVGIRHEGNTLIIPLLEEVLVVEKRLVLREEVHVKRVQHEVQESKSVLLRKEQVDITRRPGDRSGDSPGSKHGAA